MHADLEHFEKYLFDLKEQEHFLLTGAANKMLGWAFIFVRDHKYWFAMILDKSVHGCGYGTLLLSRLKGKRNSLNGWVIDHANDRKQNGNQYISPLDFYLKNGFTTSSADRLELDKISAVKIEWSK